MYKISTILVFFLSVVTAFAQLPASRVLVRNTASINNMQAISVKWYTNELYYVEGVNVYRKEGSGEWAKLNKISIKKLNDLPKSEYAKDKDLDFFVPLINKGKKEDLKGLMLINVLAKTFESEVFSRFLGIQIEDTTVKAGVLYTYKVSKIKGSLETTLGESVSLTAGDETLELPMKDISLIVDTNKVKFKWRHEDQRFYSVNIYREFQSGQWNRLNREPVMISKYKDSLGRYQYPKVFYIDDSLAPGMYVYQLAGVDFFGKETQRSASFKAEVKDVIPPPAAEALEDSIRNLDVYLTWKLPNLKDVFGINVFRSTKSNGSFTKLNAVLLPPTTKKYYDKVPKAGPYYYHVSTIDAAGNESKSLQKFSEVHDIVPPSRPLGVVARADTGKIILTWQKNKEGDLLGYRIFRTINKNDPSKFVLINSIPIRENNFVDKMPVNAKNKFLYKVLAVDSSYNKSEASEIVAAQMRDIIPPVKPYIKDLKTVNNSVVLTWLANKDADLKGYEIYRAFNNDPFAKVSTLLLGIKETTFTDNQIQPGVYSYYLIAMDSSGNRSLPSNPWSWHQKPSLINSALTNVKVKYNSGKKSVNLSWNFDKSNQFIGYVIFRKDGGIGQLAPVSEKVKRAQFVDKDIKQPATYYYEIRAYDKSGNIIKSEITKITI